MNWLSRTVLPKIKALVSPEPAKENLWIKCGACSQMIFHRECEENWNTCNACGFHMPLAPEARSRLLCDAGSISSISVATSDKDPLGFRDRKRYSDRLKEARTKTGDDDAISVSTGRINGNPVVIATFNFAFMGGSMGQTVGNGIVKSRTRSNTAQGRLDHCSIIWWRAYAGRYPVPDAIAAQHCCH